MDKNKFLKDFLSGFDEPKTGYDLNTEFRSIDGWDSLTAMTIISIIDDDYDVIINPDQMNNCNTILDVYNLINGS